MLAKPWIYETENVSERDEHIITHPNPESVSLSVRASALVFNDVKSQNLLSLIKRVAPSDATALIMGETGTGKEMIARHLHDLSPRKRGPFAAINCGAFSETLVESELFGYERGAFTGATTSKVGWFESANGGTLFLDEIGDLPQPTQVKLLRVLQEREIVRVGSRKPTPIDVRMIAATNVNLEDAVRAGRFREDLYYRIKVVPIEIPPLRERPDDILPLAEHFLRVYQHRLATSAPRMSSETILALTQYPWPGNIRELENTMHRALLVSSGGALQPRDLHLPSISLRVDNTTNNTSNPLASNHSESGVELLGAALAELFESSHPNLFELVNAMTVKKAYEYCNHNQVHTANLLGISRNILRTRLKEINLIA